MPRNISFALTTQQIRDRSKDVTRRRGWKFLKPGDLLQGCVKCMGLGPGGKIERLAQIRVVSVRREPLSKLRGKYGREEARREGFPELDGPGFAAMFRSNLGGGGDEELTRIEFEYVEGPDGG